MAGPEVLQSAAHLSQKAGELSPLFSLDSLQHLAAPLRSLGHPYGILLYSKQTSSNNLPLPLALKDSTKRSSVGISMDAFLSVTLSSQTSSPVS